MDGDWVCKNASDEKRWFTSTLPSLKNAIISPGDMYICVSSLIISIPIPAVLSINEGGVPAGCTPPPPPDELPPLAYWPEDDPDADGVGAEAKELVVPGLGSEKKSDGEKASGLL